MKKNKRALYGAVLTSVLTVLVVYQYGFLSVAGDIRQMREEKDIKLKTLSKYHYVISGRDSLREDILSVRRLLKDEELKLITGDTQALASASLQGMLKQIITEKGATITSERVERTEEKEGYRVVSVSVDMTVNSVSVLSDIIYNIESRTPYMVIQELNIRLRNYRDPSDLTVRLRVSGLSRV